jgi:hydrogenase expression/formation protein HypD
VQGELSNPLRSREYGLKIANEVNKESENIVKRLGRPVRIMNFCGTHEWTITHYGIRSLVSHNVELIPGPGCPVCITPGYYVDLLIDLSFNNYTVLTYGDAYKLPGTSGKKLRSLFQAASIGGRVRVVYSFTDAVKIATEKPSEKFVFFAVGFETTIPATAIPIFYGKVPDNLYVLIAYRYTPPVMKYLLINHPEVEIDGIIAPGHVSAIIGSESWRFLPDEFRLPVVVSGFEPIDVLTSILLIVKMLNEGKPNLVNEYSRVVKPEGSAFVKDIMNRVHENVDSYWRGIGVIPGSGARLREPYKRLDILTHLGLEEEIVEDKLPGCICDKVVLGLTKPVDCPLFMKACKPQSPYGPCMVSSEGACRIWAESI